MTNRVTQLDVLDLDSYLTDLLIRQEVDKCFQLSPLPMLLRLKPWLKTGLYATLLYQTAGKFQQTVAQRLFDVIMTDAKCEKAQAWRILCYVAIETACFWWKEFYGDDYPQFLSLNTKVIKICKILENIIRITRLCNFLLFLKQGQFSSLLLLALGLKLSYSKPNSGDRVISYTIPSREILWRGFAEIMMDTVTQLDFNRIKRHFVLSQTSESSIGIGVSKFKHCCICSEWPTQPHESNCGHISCYYCSSIFILQGRKCPVCSIPMSSHKMIGLT